MNNQAPQARQPAAMGETQRNPWVRMPNNYSTPWWRRIPAPRWGANDSPSLFSTGFHPWPPAAAPFERNNPHASRKDAGRWPPVERNATRGTRGRRNFPIHFYALTGGGIFFVQYTSR